MGPLNFFMLSFRRDQYLPIKMWEFHFLLYEDCSRVIITHTFDTLRRLGRGWTIPSQTLELSLASLLAAASDMISISIY